MSGLKALHAPAVIGILVALIFSCPGLNWKEGIQHFETFAGAKSVTCGELEAGRSAVPFELVDDPFTQDILTPEGFTNAIFNTLRLEEGSGLFQAPVCSTWVFMSRGSTLRSNSRPLGRTDSQKVHDGNIMTSRCMILCILAAAKGVWWLVEQPATSIMELHPSFQIALKLLAPIRRLRVLMLDFGGSSKKPTYLYSSHSCIDDLLDERRPPSGRSDAPEMVVRYIDSKGVARCKGGRDLKCSQHYPRRFGRCLAKVRSKNFKQVRRAARTFLKSASKSGSGLNFKKTSHEHWMKHANLLPMLQYLASFTAS